MSNNLINGIYDRIKSFKFDDDSLKYLINQSIKDFFKNENIQFFKNKLKYNEEILIVKEYKCLFHVYDYQTFRGLSIISINKYNPLSPIFLNDTCITNIYSDTDILNNALLCDAKYYKINWIIIKSSRFDTCTAEFSIVFFNIKKLTNKEVLYNYWKKLKYIMRHPWSPYN